MRTLNCHLIQDISTIFRSGTTLQTIRHGRVHIHLAYRYITWQEQAGRCPRGGRWLERTKPRRLEKSIELVPGSQYLILLLTFAFVGRGPGDVRGFVDVEHITSNELRDFRLGFLLQMEFTYVFKVESVQYTILQIRYDLPSMMYMTVGPKKCPRMGWPASISPNHVIK